MRETNQPGLGYTLVWERDRLLKNDGLL